MANKIRIKSCSSCGSDTIALVSVRGQSFSYKNYPSLKVTVGDLKVQTCTNCGESFYNRSDSEQLDIMIKKSITSHISIFLDILKSKGLSQRDTRTRIGITESFLSKIKSGNEIPSFGVYNSLKVMALSEDATKISDPDFIPEDIVA